MDDARARSVKFRDVDRNAVKARLMSKLRADRDQRRSNALSAMRDECGSARELLMLCGDFGLDPSDDDALQYLIELENELRAEEAMLAHEHAVAMDDPELYYMHLMEGP